MHPDALDRVLASPTAACASAKSWWEGQGWLAGVGYGEGYRKPRTHGVGRGSGVDGAGVARAFDACCAFGGGAADLTKRYVDGAVLDITAHDVVPPLVEPSRIDHTRSLLQEVRPPTQALSPSEYLAVLHCASTHCQCGAVAQAQSVTRRVGTSEYLKGDFTLGRMNGRGTYGVVFEVRTLPYPPPPALGSRSHSDTARVLCCML